MTKGRHLALWISTVLLLEVVIGAPMESSSSGLKTENGTEQKEKPQIEKELESLKIKNSDNAAPTNTVAIKQDKPSIPVKLEVNMEKPTVSDNSGPDSILTSSEIGGFTKFTDKRRDIEPINLEMDYTPQDIAEYIFWTGDERGVALTLNDFLQDGLVSRDDALHFLEQVKKELKELRTRFSPQASIHEEPKRDSHNSMGSRATSSSSAEQFFPRAFTNLPGSIPPLSSVVGGPKAAKSSSASNEEQEYEDILLKLGMLDTKYRENSLEEIIYQLAKELFSDGLQKSSSDEQPKHSIQRFAQFVERQAAKGKIPKDLEKSVLDTLVSALVDSISEKDNFRNMMKNDGMSQIQSNKGTAADTH